MTGKDVRAARRRLGLTQVVFAERVGVQPNTVYRWESDTLTVGSTAAILIRLLARLHRAATAPRREEARDEDLEAAEARTPAVDRRLPRRIRRPRPKALPDT